MRFILMHPTAAGACRDKLKATTVVDALKEAEDPIVGSELRTVVSGKRVVVAHGRERDEGIVWELTCEGARLRAALGDAAVTKVEPIDARQEALVRLRGTDLDGSGQLTVRALRWIRSNDVGLSSETIFRVMMGETCARPEVPSDRSDFGRCHRLLKAFPEWLARLGEVAAAYPRWSPFVRDWSLLSTLYERVEELHRTDAYPSVWKFGTALLQIEITRCRREGGDLR
jgi:hypothetical protein